MVGWNCGFKNFGFGRFITNIGGFQTIFRKSVEFRKNWRKFTVTYSKKPHMLLNTTLILWIALIRDI